ncbi:NAD(P)H-dependent FMN reductase/ribosomal protein S18 acetylase RimI-like enzyme [Nonomuraea thailandensis]|uniref:NAD(P)H-dependent FMN reductase/ribosomal protein S18 acetylase RimI-like enzyme n=1 Tax=Nonomuraea thailandensis TaxID=1188745 RepID=A0A9X2GLK8_9ACTN|nr:bifunctional NAD(P)H-dependent oxidoreductase/GNAT family N-acetyltransferase [Nonomuraea thailandensis]MCP2356503.1 NAD(P)H-dependent FMN reductase/ribosomal protein S18 acetylase RimI-like enzyme [Nonomuraea thailandensis]
MSTKPLRVIVLMCSTRPGALGPAVGRWLIDTIAPRATELGVELQPVALGDLALPFLDEEEEPASGLYRNEHTKRWSAMVDEADGFIAVTPEYNYGMPAAFKNALDYLGREWAWKPMGFVSYGNTSAGTRSVQHAKQVVTTLRLVPLGATVALRIADALDGGRVRPDAGRDRAAVGVLDELARLAHALRPMRERTRSDSGTAPVPGAYVRALTPDDAPEVLVLQRCCWLEEALANDTLAIPALEESLDQVRAWLATWQATGLWRDGRLLGMVRARRVDDDWHVGRLGVVPDLRGQGVGRWLLREAEAAAGASCRRIVLATGARSRRNLDLYHAQGYRTESSDGATALLTKPVTADGVVGEPVGR